MASESGSLSKSWTLFYHDPNNAKWDIGSYIPLYNIRSVDDFWMVFGILKQDHISNGMFFLMAEGSEPTWEHESNRDGGCWTKKVPSDKAPSAFLELCIHAICDVMLMDKGETITGVSISPKFKCNIIKIWNNDKKINDIQLLNPKLIVFDKDGVLYKEHEVGK